MAVFGHFFTLVSFYSANQCFFWWIFFFFRRIFVFGVFPIDQNWKNQVLNIGNYSLNVSPFDYKTGRFRPLLWLNMPNHKSGRFRPLLPLKRKNGRSGRKQPLLWLNMFNHKSGRKRPFQVAENGHILLMHVNRPISMCVLFSNSVIKKFTFFGSTSPKSPKI